MSKEAGILGGEAKGSTMCPWINGLKKRLKHSREDMPMDGH